MNVKHRAEWFGRVREGFMVLNADGLIAHRCWAEIPEHFPGVKVDAFVVMPDHVHGIIIIDDASFPGDGQPNHAIIPVVVGSYKSAVSKLIHRFGSPSFQWQRSYHHTQTPAS
ncbi:MAG: transposase, partial [Spirochaetes bacterium]|nr:transposase [Spirochaetota bacterium]